MKRFNRIVSGIALAMLGIGFLLISLRASKEDWKDIGWETYDGSYEAAYSELENVTIEVPYGLVYVGTAPGTQVLFEARNIKADSMQETLTEGRLSLANEVEFEEFRILHATIPYQLVSFTSETGWEESSTPVYVLLLPKGYQGSVEIDVAYGSVRLEDTSMESVGVTINCGEIRSREITAQTAEFFCDAGNVDLEGSFGELTAKVDCGRLKAEIDGAEEDYSCDFQCYLGNLEDSGNDRIGFNRVHTERANSGSTGKVTLSCYLGELEVNFLK